MGIDGFAIHLIAGIAAAIAGPMLLEMVLARRRMTRQLLLGLR